MCGIVGVFSSDGLAANDLDRLSTALSLITHRGPDSAEVTEVPPYGAVGFARLAINDVEHGNQPFVTSGGRYLTWVNGEIYNADEIRARIHDVGISLTSRSDCEPVAHLAHKGPQLVNELHGMFALASFDRESQILLLARDRFGQKPLYYSVSDTHFYFASELTALLALDHRLTQVKETGLAAYFYYDWIPEPLSPLAGVAKVPADTAITWRFGFEPYPAEHQHSPRSDFANNSSLADAFEESVGSMLSSDVPVGIALSGGIDSSLVAATARSLSTTEIHSFTVAFEGLYRGGEAHLAATTARSLNLVHHEVPLTRSSVVEAFPTYAMEMDEPVADVTGLAYRQLMSAAKTAGVPVLLFGHGADELMWGYPWVTSNARRFLRESSQWHWRDDAHRLVQQFRRTHSRRDAARAVKTALARPAFPWRRDLARSGDFYGERPDYISAKFAACSVRVLSPAPELFPCASPGTPLQAAILRPLLRGYLRENGLTQLDRLSMLHSVEVRLPFLGDPFVDFVLQPDYLESGLKTTGKWALRQLARGRVPDAVLTHPKRGFAPPSQFWLDAIMERWGSKLIGGRLFDAGVLSDEDIRRFLAWKDRAISIHPLWYRALLLEFWWRGKEASLGRSLELSVE